MSLRWAKSHNIEVDPAGSVPIIAADGKRMMCEGSARIQIHYEDAKIETEALVSSVLKENLLISWCDLKKLDVLWHNFPHRIQITPKDFQYRLLKADLEETVRETGCSAEAYIAQLGTSVDQDVANRALHECNVVRRSLCPPMEDENETYGDQPLSPIKKMVPGTPVVIQNRKSLRWTVFGTVVDLYRGGRRLKVQLANGKVYFRNQHHVRPRTD